MTPELAKQRIEEYSRVTNINERAMLFRQLMIDLCQAGYTEEAWALINDHAGKVRDYQRQAFFQTAKLPQAEIMAKIRELEVNGYAGEQLDAMGAYMEQFGFTEVSELVQSPDFLAITAKTRAESLGWFHNTMAAYFLSKSHECKSESEQTGLVESARMFFSDGLIGDENLIGILRRADAVSPFEKWKIMSDTVTRPIEDRDFDGAKIIDEMVTADAPKSLDLIAKWENDPSGSFLTKALRVWSNQEPESAAKWFETNRAQLSPQQLDAASQGFCEQALIYKERNGAIRWAEQIKDPKLRARTLERVFTAFPK